MFKSKWRKIVQKHILAQLRLNTILTQFLMNLAPTVVKNPDSHNDTIVTNKVALQQDA